jgi:hypothetical protein
MTIAFREKTCQFRREFGFLSAREGVHRPANSYTEQKKEKQRPKDVFQPIGWFAPTQETKRNRNNQGKQDHGLKMAQFKSHRRDQAFRPRAAS